MIRTAPPPAVGSPVPFLVAVLLLAGCTGRSTGEGVGGEGGASSSLVAAVRVEPDPVPTGGAMGLALEVTNRADTAVSLDFTTGQRFDFAVRRGGEEVGRWSSDMMFTQALGTEIYAAGEIRSFEADMDAPSEPGEYTVVGWITSSDAAVRDSVAVTVR